jgi:hypothetical protein
VLPGATVLQIKVAEIFVPCGHVHFVHLSLKGFEKK